MGTDFEQMLLRSDAFETEAEKENVSIELKQTLEEEPMGQVNEDSRFTPKTDLSP